MTDQGFDFDAELIKLLPDIRAYAAALMRQRDSGDDLMQDTLVRALRWRHTFSPGTNLKAWLYTILRNGFITTTRRKPPEQVYGSRDLASPAAQDHAVALRDLSRLLQRLPTNQRKALLMVGANGYSYSEAAAIAGTRIGTVKSRVARARASLHLHFDAAAPGGRLPASPDQPASPLHA
jgi:RNA polymerase sigma-70 factor (ECF subfamily)